MVTDVSSPASAERDRVSIIMGSIAPALVHGRSCFSDRIRWIRTFCLLLAPFVISVRGSVSAAPSAIADSDAGEIARASQRRVEIESANKACEDVLIAAGRRALDSQFGLLQQLNRLTNVEQKGIREFLEQRTRAATKALQSEINAHEAYVSNDFVPAWERLVSEQRRVARARDAFERDERRAQQAALALGTEHRWFWLSALVAVAVLMGVVLVDHRHELRRYLNGGQARALGLSKLLVAAFIVLCMLTAALFFTSDGILVEFLERTGGETVVTRLAARASEDAKKVTEAEARQAAREKDVEQLRRELADGVAKCVPPEQAGGVFDAWWSYLQTTARRRAQSMSLEQNRQRFDAVVAEVNADDAAITSARASARKWRRYASRISGVIGLGILGLIGAGAVVFVRGAKARQQKIFATCPNCLGEGQLESAHSDNGKVRCTNVISNSPDPIECEFEFPAHLREYPKLSFPTLGIRHSGKTFWLTQTYDRLTSRDYPAHVNFTPVRTSASDKIEKTVRDILTSKIDTQATQHGVPPPPVVFDFSDHDSYGQSSILVNLFDYSGEVTEEFPLTSHQRRRAFSADGYLWFLDPTSDVNTGLSQIPEQKKALSRFESEVREVKKLKAGQQLHRPIAICVPKIDLMINERYAEGGNVVERFYEQLGEIGWGMDEVSIRQRSDLMRNLRHTIWPNWEIERAVDDLFGGRYMFFPLTPVGLDEPGQKDLKRRTIAPVGILHPLMWLLHMNGYPVLPRRTAQ